MSNILEKATMPPTAEEAFETMAPDNTVQTLAKGSALTANKSSDQAVAPDVAASTLEEGLAKTADSPSHPAMIQRGTTGTSKEKATEKAKKANDNTISKPVTSANVKKASGRGKQKEQTTKNRQYKKRVRMTRKEAARKKEWLINHREAKYQHQMEEGEDVDDFDITKPLRATASENKLFDEYLAMNPDSDNDNGW